MSAGRSASRRRDDGSPFWVVGFCRRCWVRMPLLHHGTTHRRLKSSPNFKSSPVVGWQVGPRHRTAALRVLQQDVLTSRVVFWGEGLELPGWSRRPGGNFSAERSLRFGLRGCLTGASPVFSAVPGRSLSVDLFLGGTPAKYNRIGFTAARCVNSSESMFEYV